jgi:hypothetical protein
MIVSIKYYYNFMQKNSDSYNENPAFLISAEKRVTG